MKPASGDHNNKKTHCNFCRKKTITKNGRCESCGKPKN